MTRPHRCLLGLLGLALLGSSSCATTAPGFTLPPADADPRDREIAFRRFHVDSIKQRTVSSNVSFYNDYSAQLGGGQEVQDPRKLAAVLPNSKKMHRYARRYRGFRIASWVSLPLSIGAFLLGGVSLYHWDPDTDSQINKQRGIMGVAGLGAGAVLGLTHYLLYSLSSESAHNAYEHYNQALEARLQVNHVFVGPEYIPTH